jgi:hypothetical protein
MRRGMRWRRAIALGLGLGLATLAKADEDDVKPPAPTGNWFTHLFSKDTHKKKDADGKKSEVPARPSAAMIRQKAQAEWLRRQEVCDKLRAIALESGDKELARKADALDQRAWDLYVQRTGGAKLNAAPPEPLLDDPSGMDAAPRFRSSAPTNGSVSAGVDSRTAARKD